MTASAAWPAPSLDPGCVVDATVRVPGSKSLTNRALVLAAQATGPSTIRGALRSRDTDLMAAALARLGVGVRFHHNPEAAGTGTAGTGTAGTGTAGTGTAGTESADSVVTVTPRSLAGPVTVDCGLAGTVMRFVPPLAAGAVGDITFDGDAHARRRPMGAIVGALRDLGVEVSGDALPFVVHGRGAVTGGEVRIDASASSQFVSGLLLAGAGYRRGVTVVHDGPPVPSMPHITMTVAALRSVGVEVDDSTDNMWAVPPAPVRPWSEPIDPDLSNATPFLAAAAVTGGTVLIPHWPARTTQAGDGIRWVLEAMGAEVARTEAGLRVTGPPGAQGLRAADLDLHDIGELTPTIAALALFADGPTRLRGVAHLRGHETDRLAALVANINGLGGDAEELPDGLVIRPRPLHGGGWPAWADHRMATAGAIVGLRVPDVLVDDINSTAKTLPGFDRIWAAMLAGAPTPGSGAGPVAGPVS